MKSLLLFGAAFFAANGLKQMDWATEFTRAELEELDTMAAFENWHKTFERNYPTRTEEAHRYSIWLENLGRIAESNSQGLTYKLRMNQFGDMTDDEFKYYVNGPTGSCIKTDGMKPFRTKTVSEPVTAPASVDWRKEGVVTPVKNQGQCGSCWAFSTTGSMECDYAIKTKVLTSLSEQELVDCSSAYGNQGCNGGWYYYAWQYAVENKGLCTEQNYPYKGVQGSCNNNCGQKYNPPTGYTKVTADNDVALEDAAALGCVSIAIEADQMAFQYYSSGVLTGTCGTKTDHAVLVVGYTSEYYIVKNSWGTSWGEQGYVNICRNCNANGNEGECGIYMYPAYPKF